MADKDEQQTIAEDLVVTKYKMSGDIANRKYNLFFWMARVVFLRRPICSIDLPICRVRFFTMVTFFSIGALFWLRFCGFSQHGTCWSLILFGQARGVGVWPVSPLTLFDGILSVLLWLGGVD